MKILHVCLSGYFSEGWSYQDNLIVKAHASMGHDVFVFASQYYRDRLSVRRTKRTNYKTVEGATIYRFSYRYDRLPLSINSEFRLYKHIEETLYEISPDLIMVHGGQFLSIISVTKYLRQNRCKAVIDYHSDEYNSANNLLSKYILHRLLWRFLSKKTSKYFNKIYYVAPSVRDFVVKNYHVDTKKLEFLPLGADYDEIQRIRNSEIDIRKIVRDRHNISYDSVVFIHGGKINQKKNTNQLLLAFHKVRQKYDNCYLFIFGQKENCFDLGEFKDGVIYLRWLTPAQIYEYYLASDVAVFPGSQSVLWQQAIASGLPLICKYWAGCEYLDLGGNVFFLEKENSDYLANLMAKFIQFPMLRTEMGRISNDNGKVIFSYREIAGRLIEDNA